MIDPTEEQIAGADEILAPVFDDFKRRAAQAIAETCEGMRNVLRVRYDAEASRLPADVPAPRLQLRWEGEEDAYRVTCHYELVFPLREHDVRNDPKTGFALVELGRTIVSGGGTPTWAAPHPRDAMPYRDGVHAFWDAAVFGGLPVYVIAPDGTARLVPPREDNN